MVWWWEKTFCVWISFTESQYVVNISLMFTCLETLCYIMCNKSLAETFCLPLIQTYIKILCPGNYISEFHISVQYITLIYDSIGHVSQAYWKGKAKIEQAVLKYFTSILRNWQHSNIMNLYCLAWLTYYRTRLPYISKNHKMSLHSPFGIHNTYIYWYLALEVRDERVQSLAKYIIFFSELRKMRTRGWKPA